MAAPGPSPVPRRCFWELTRRCDHRCLHCRASAERAVAGELSGDEALVVAEDLAELGVPRVVLTGGEPTLYPAWEEVARRLAGGEVEVRLFTGGYGLDRRLLDRALSAGVAGFTLSLDGPRAVHDRLRPTRGVLRGSSYDRAVNAIELLVAQDLAPRVVTAVSALNVDHLGPLYQTVRDLGVTRWQVNLCQLTGRAREHRDDLAPAPADLDKVVAVLTRAAREGVVVAPMHCTVGYMTAEEPVLRRPLSEKRLVWRGTPAGLHTMAITATGGVLGCTALPDEFATANVRQRRLADIWADDDCFPYSRGFSPDQLAGECVRCELAPICRAGCPAVAYGATGSVGANPYCLRVVRGKNS